MKTNVEKIKHFQGLGTLISMQFKEKMSFSFKADKKGALTKLLLYVILMVGVGGALAVIFTLLGKASIFAFGEVPPSIFNFFFIIMFVVSLLACLNGLTNSLYFSEDNQVLLTYPVKSNTVFFSKIIVYYIFELIKNFGMMVPYFVAYGIVYKFPWFYYFWVILCFLIVSFIPVAISGIISIPFMYIKMFLKKYSLAQNIVLLAFVMGVTALAIWIITLIPERLDIAKQWSTIYLPGIRSFVSKTEKIFLPVSFLTMLITGYNYGVSTSARSLKVFTSMTGPIFGCVMGVIVVAILFTYFVVKPLFFKMASKPFEYAKKVISHDYKIDVKDAKEEFTGDYFVLTETPEFASKGEAQAFTAGMKKLLRILKKEEKLFLNRKINLKRVLRFINKYSGSNFTLVHCDEKYNPELTNCYAVIVTDGVPALVYVEDIKLHVHLYDPNHLSGVNKKHESTISALIKEILVDIRTPGVFVSNYIMVVLPPVALLLLNTIFNACGLKNPLGYWLAMMFDMILVLLIILTTNISMASIYSREGKTSYMLKAAPVNFVKTLGTKLIIRAVLMTLSIIGIGIVYSLTNKQYYAHPLMFTITILCVYLGHLLWSAELDYMNPQDKLYAETGDGNISNPNETLSTIIGMIVAAVLGFLTYFFLKDNNALAMLKLMFIGMAFLGARIYLFIKRIIAYSTSRGERGRN